MAKHSTIKKGYKQTEIGVIPEDWEIEEIKNLTSITTGAKNTQDRIEDGLYPFFVRSQTVERINSYSYDGEAVLTAGDGVGTGKVFHYINDKFDFHQRVYKISDFNEKLNGYFFYLYFSNSFYNRIMQMTAKSSVDSVRMEMIAEMQIPLPSKNEQTAIAEVLSDTDALIESLEKQIAKKKAIKQGTMQQLLTGKKRLPGFSGEWEVKKLKNLCTLEYGSSLESKEYDNFSESFVYGTSGIVGNSSKFLSIGESVVIGRKGTINKPIYIPKQQKFWVIDTAFYLKSEENIQYLFYLLSSIDFSKYNESTGVPSLNRNTFYEILVLIPKSLAEQTAIAEILSDMDSEIEVLEQKCEKYKKIKQGMMQQLLTGKIRLVNP